jgi:hypothetical protein
MIGGGPELLPPRYQLLTMDVPFLLDILVRIIQQEAPPPDAT